jgi:hypothetical protein
VNVTALAILTALGANLVISALFYLTVMSASVWSYTTLGYYSMSIYPQIGFLGLIGVLAIVHWRNGGSANYKWLSLAVSAIAPFIHPSGAYVPVAVGGFAYVSAFARRGGKHSLFAMFGPDLRWLTIGLAAVLVVFALFFAAAVHAGPFLSMAHNPLSIEAVVRSIYYLLSQGMVLEFLRPFIPRLLSRSDLAVQGVVALVLASAFVAVGITKIRVEQRWTYLALLVPALVNVLVVSFGRRLNGIEDVVNTAGKYNNFSYLWFTVSTFYLLACLAPRIPWRWRRIAVTASLVIVGMAFISLARQPNRYAAEAALRSQQMNDLMATFNDYANRTASRSMHIPTLDGAFIIAEHPLLHVYNLTHYRPFFEGFDARLTLLRNAAMDTWGMESAQTVPSLRSATDPEFFRALETDAKLQSAYSGSVELRPLTKPRFDGQSLRLDAVKIGNADVIHQDGRSLSIATAGGASITLLENDWDSEQAHILSMRIDANSDNSRADARVLLEVDFEGRLPIPYAANKLTLSKDVHDISVDLLQIYSYALNDRVGKLGLRFPRAGRYTISDIRLGR